MRNKKNIIIAIMIAVAVIMATGYAYFLTKLNINATGSISSTWNIYFLSIDEGTAVGKAENIGTPSASGTSATMSAKLEVPGDSMTYKLILKNGGTVGAIIENIEAVAEGSSAIVFSIDGIKKGDKLSGGAEKEITIKIEYDPNVTSQPQETTKTLTININAVQDTGQTIDEENITINQAALLSTAILGSNKSNVVSSGDGLYVSTATNDGRPTYYYKGNVTNNYVDFAGLTWRIVRINEDGTIKLILDDRIDDTGSQFNSNYDKYEYMYYSNSNVENGIKNTVDTWYINTLEENYDSYIATTSFCESAKVKCYDLTASGIETMELSSNYTPNFECPLDGNGKQYVNEKVGLITADEVAMVGLPLYTGSQTNNTNTYLQKSYYWWTMSPAGFDIAPDTFLVWDVSLFGWAGSGGGYSGSSVRPVISLNANVQVTGLGTEGSPYVVKTN